MHRVMAMRRLGHDVTLIDLREFLPNRGIAKRLVSKLVFECGGGIFESYIQKKLTSAVKGREFDIAWVNGGELAGPRIVRHLKKIASKAVNYHNDDPFGGRDRQLWKLFLKAVPFYDAVIVMRKLNVTEAYAAGAKRVIRTWMTADEIAHAPAALTSRDQADWASEVVFIGTWMPERGPFMARLLELGVPLTIYGDRWQKAEEWPLLKSVWRRGNIDGADYIKAISASKVCLALLSKGNRDLHTTRSSEIPFAGGLLCAERTVEHQRLYVEDREAVFWESADECAIKCRQLLLHRDLRDSIRQAGRARCLQNGLLNEIILKGLLDALQQIDDEIPSHLKYFTPISAHKSAH